MPAIYEHQLVVNADDIDVLGHVNNLAYLRWMQDAAVAHSAAQGWPTARYLESGAGWVVRSHAIEYRQPAFVDQKIVIRTWIANFKRIQSLRKYQILRREDDAVLAVAQTNWAYIGFAHQVPRRVPPEIIDAFVLVEAADEPPLPRQSSMRGPEAIVAADSLESQAAIADSQSTLENKMIQGTDQT